MTSNEFRFKMRVVHRYLGFFLAGIMAVYAISGIILIFRDTDFLKNKEKISLEIKKGANEKELSKLLKIKRLKVNKKEGDILYFKDGQYNKNTGVAEYTKKELPYILDKMAHLHKAKSSEPLFFLNIFFGLSLLFFVISSFWMFLPQTSIFKKGLYFSLGGILLTLILLFL